MFEVQANTVFWLKALGDRQVKAFKAETPTKAASGKPRTSAAVAPMACSK